MKKLALLLQLKTVLICFILMPMGLHAQLFSGGIVVQGLATQIDGDKHAGYKRAGLSLGGFIELPLGDKFSLKLQPSWVYKGARKNVDIEKKDLEFWLVRLHYVEVPLLLRIKSHPKFLFEAGLSYGFLVSASIETEDGLRPENSYNLRKSEIAIHAALLYKMNDNWSGRMGFSYSLVPINETPAASVWYNNVLSLGLVYYIMHSNN